MNALRIVFMGTPDFAVPCLDMLVEEQYNIVGVVTQPDRPKGRGQKVSYSPIKEAALGYGLSVLQPAKIKEPEFVAELERLQPDMIIVVAFGQLLPKSILELPPLGCINVHASLLPYYRGAAPIHWSVIHGERLAGITTMYMDVGMDTGDMLLKAEVSIGDDDTTGMVHDKLKALGAEVLRDTIQGIISGAVERMPQNHEDATYAPMLTRQLEKIKWTDTAVKLHNLIRGLNPWPGAYCVNAGRNLKIWRSRIYVFDDAMTVPGRVTVSEAGFIVETGQGSIEILEVQPESKRRMSAKEYVSGYGLVSGVILE